MKIPKSWAIAGAAAAVTTLIGIVAFPRPPQLMTVTGGDMELVATVSDLLDASPGPHHRLSVAVVDGDSTTFAHFGAADDTEYEIGSVTKTITAALFADAIRRGEVSEDTRLGELLDLGESPAADVTLLALATHRSGLPRLPLTPDVILSAIGTQFTAGDPYRFDLAALLAQTRAATLADPAEFAYSNLGFALLGQALAAAADTTYSGLVTERVFGSLDMADSFVPTTTADLLSTSPSGFTATGRAADPWTMNAYAAAGSIRSTASDMVRYIASQLDGTAVGVQALDPRASAGEGAQVGYAWLTTPAGAEGREATWHNGMTGGFASFVGMDRKTGRGVVVLSDTAVSVDAIGLELLQQGTE